MTRLEAAPTSAWVLSATAVAALGACAVAASLVTTVPVVIAFSGWTGVIVLGGALLAGRPGAVGWAIGIVGGTWAIVIAAGSNAAAGTLHPAVVAVAPGLLVAAELAYWSLEPASRAPGARLRGQAVARRLGDLAATALATAAAAVGVLGVAGTTGRSGFAIEAAGVTALLAVLATIVGLAVRWASPPR